MSVPELIAELEGEGARLWEESGQLRFRAPKGVMTDERRMVLRESRQVVLDYLRRRDEPAELVPRPEERFEPFPLTDVQSAYLLGRLDVFPYGGVACHGYGELPFRDLDPARLERAWRALVRRHDMLRAVIDPSGSQRVLPDVPDYQVQVVDLRGADPAQVAATIGTLRAEMSHRVYEPGEWPLFDLRASLADSGSLLHFSIDFLISDLVSTQLLLDELHRIYHEPGAALPPLDITFRDYVLAEQGSLQGERYEFDRAWWLGRLHDLPPAPDLPVLERRQGGAVRFRRRQMKLAPERWRGLRACAGRRGVTPSMVVLATYAEVVGRWSRKPRFTLNLTLQSRRPLHPQAGSLVGDFTSVALLAVAQDPAASVGTRAQVLQARLWEDLDHRRFSGLRVARELARRDGQGAGLFPVVFTSAIGVNADDSVPQTVGELAWGITQTSQVWIDCQALEGRQGLIVNWDVREGVFPDGLVDDMFTAFARLLGRLADEDAAWDLIDPVPLPAAQRERRHEVNDTAAPLPDALLHEALVEYALREPQRFAVASGGRSLSYGELLGRAATVVEMLHAEGYGRGQVVAVAMDKGWEQVAAVLGILLAGAVYLPVDTSQPPVRRDRILADAGVRLACVQSGSMGGGALPAGIRTVAVDLLVPSSPPHAPPRCADPDDLAYVIYTSGSTGAPKGVMISHRAAVNTIADVNRRFGVGPSDRVLGLAALGFDLSVWDIFGVLGAGGGVVLPDPGRRGDPSHWAELIARHRVTLWNSVPAQLQMLHDYLATAGTGTSALGSLRLALLSGDWIPVTLPDRVRRLLPGLELMSLGGATEAAIWSIFHPIGDLPDDWPSVPYGRPLANQHWHVLDEALRPCPDLVAGELHIEGAGLALGYLGDEARTAERFIRHPETGERLYRTGDIGRYRPDGTIELLGREDRQVKIRGHRIELAEVEAAIAAHPTVAGAIVVADGEQPLERRLAAFVESGRRAEPDPADTTISARIAQTAASACAAVTTTVDAGSHAAYTRRLDEAALLAMLHALQLQGLLDGDGSTRDEILAAVASRHHRLVRRWLRALEAGGMVSRDASTRRYRAIGPARASLGEAWSEVERLAQGVEHPGLVGYFRENTRRLPELLRGDAGPLQLLFPSGRVDVSESLYRDALATRGATAMVAAVLRGIAAGWEGAEPLRVLEVGAGTGGTARDVLDALAGFEVDYLFTDLSRFFLNEARQRFRDRPWLRFALLDLDRDYRGQGLAPNSFDVVVAGDVLHATRDIDRALARLRELLTPGGWLVASEMTRDHAAIMASLELLVRVDQTVDDFTDERRGRDETFLPADAWLEALARAGAGAALCLPDHDEVMASTGMRVLVARFKADRLRVGKQDLMRHLAERLPDHMLPAHVQVVDALPLTANGKVDHRTLSSWLPARGVDPVVAGEAAAPASALERRLAELWAEVLGVDTVRRDQRFLDLGGDSLIAARLAGRLREELSRARAVFFDELLRRILESPTVAELASALGAQGRTEQPDGASAPGSPVRRLGGAGAGPVRVLVHDGGGILASYDAVAGQLAVRGPLVGLVVDDSAAYLQLDPEHLIERTADAYAGALLDEEYLSLHVVGNGPGCALALETARRLAESGAAVHSLTLILGEPPDGDGPVHQHTLLAVSTHQPPAYAGDITLVDRAGGLATASEAVARWRAACLGELRVIEVPADRPDRLVDALVDGPPPDGRA